MSTTVPRPHEPRPAEPQISPWPDPGPDATLELAPMLERVWRRRRMIATCALIGALLGVATALLLPSWYRANASLLPPSEEETGLGIANLFRGIGVPGIKVPTQATPSEVFLAILQSRRLGDEMVQRFDLKTVYKRKLQSDAIKELRRHSQFKLTQEGILELSVEDRDPKRAKAMADAYVELLDRFNRDVRMTKGRRTRIFVESRLAETRAALADAEQELTSYQARNKTVAVSPAASSAIEVAARLFAQRSALQVRLGVIQGYTLGSSDEEQQIRSQLAQLDRQLQNIPVTGLQVARLLRDVKTHETLLTLLTAQYEEARINEVRDVATVEVLDPAQVPEKRARPRRSIVAGGALLLSLVVAIGWAILDPRARSRGARA